MPFEYTAKDDDISSSGGGDPIETS